jgi:N-acetylglucosaminyldiphosphoundecaprenol N-acetyl-beta-D-mannosaminyltransferase
MVTISSICSSELFKQIQIFCTGDKRLNIGKINTEFLVRSLRNEEFREALNNCDLNIADGRGVLWAARYLTLPISNSKLIRMFQAVWQMIYSGASIVLYPKFICWPISENIPGVDALKLMLMAAEETDSGVFFFGATQDDLDGAIRNIVQEFPKLKISGSLNGYDFQSDKTIDPVEIINKTEAKLLIVALGSPLQEYWIRDNMKKLINVRVAVGEGGSLAFLAGSLKRAPKWMQKIGIEWLWRLFTNKSLTHQTGSRLKRVWNAVPVFIFEVVKWKVRHGATKVE